MEYFDRAPYYLFLCIQRNFRTRCVVDFYRCWLFFIKITYYVSSAALNVTHSLTSLPVNRVSVLWTAAEESRLSSTFITLVTITGEMIMTTVRLTGWCTGALVVAATRLDTSTERRSTQLLQLTTSNSSLT